MNLTYILAEPLNNLSWAIDQRIPRHSTLVPSPETPTLIHIVFTESLQCEVLQTGAAALHLQSLPDLLHHDCFMDSLLVDMVYFTEFP